MASYKRKQKRVTPHYKRVLGTKCVVDAFTYQSDDHSAFFLTHYHADHYGGLRASYKRVAPIYLSLFTARLVMTQLKVQENHLKILPMNQEVQIPEEPDTFVTLLDANHCPGAVLFLFRVGSLYHLHTGDMRYHPKMKLYPELQGKKIHTLYLDTTYCNDDYAFPSQDKAIESAVVIMRKERKPKTLFMFGSYTIGKERVFLKASQEFKSKVFVMPKKYQILRCIDIDAELMTQSPTETFIHVVPMNFLSYKEIFKLQNKFKHKFDRIVGFKPTGWSLGKKSFTKYGDNIVYSIPYSEHSSVVELREFVAWLKPAEIVPTVNGGDERKVNQMIKELYKKPKPPPRSIFSFFTSPSIPSGNTSKDAVQKVEIEVKTKGGEKTDAVPLPPLLPLPASVPATDLLTTSKNVISSWFRGSSVPEVKKTEIKEEEPKAVKEVIVDIIDSKSEIISLLPNEGEVEEKKKEELATVHVSFDDFDDDFGVEDVDLMFLSQQRWIERRLVEEKKFNEKNGLIATSPVSTYVDTQSLSSIGKRKRKSLPNTANKKTKQQRLPALFLPPNRRQTLG